MASFSVTVFCGSSPGVDPAYAAAATALGRGIAAAGMALVFGGGNVGLMGITAGAALAARRACDRDHSGFFAAA